MSSLLRWNMMEDNVRKTVYLCVCVCVCVCEIRSLCCTKLMEHCKPTIMEKNKHHFKKRFGPWVSGDMFLPSFGSLSVSTFLG